MKVREREPQTQYVVLDFVGDADIIALDAIKQGILASAEKNRNIVCNLSEVRHINSAGVNAFLLPAKTITSRGGEIVFCAMRPNVERVFKLGRLDKYLRFFPTLNDAQTYFSTHGKVDLSENENILIIEKKNQFIRKHVEDILKDSSSVSQIDFYTAKSTDQAIRFMKSKRFSLALFDSTFSLGEGKEFIDTMLSAEGQENLPILVVMTSDTQDSADYFIRSGAHDVIQFPFNKLEVNSRVRYMISSAKKLS